MSALADVVGQDLAAYYRMVREQTHKWVDPLTTEQIWTNPYGYGNDIGHLLLHMTGNLNYYIGARVANSGYERDRPREFSEAQRRSKEEVLAAFDETIDLVVATIKQQGPDDWLKPYSGEREPEAQERFHIFLRCAGHAYHHVGQIINLVRELTK